MPEDTVQFIDVGTGPAKRRLAVLAQPPSPDLASASGTPGIFWLQGFKSSMISLKASALADWTKERGLGFTRFDYSGHGQSSGRFGDGTIGAWLEDAEAVFDHVTHGPQILVGSSMGGWLALLLLRRALARGTASAERIKGLVLIAPAWDMTEELMWKKAPPAIRKELQDNGFFLRPSDYDDEPYVISMKLIEEGRHHLIRNAPFNPGRPVRIIHGELDPDVPFSHSQELQKLMPGAHIEITSVPDGEHRLSRPQDLDLLCTVIQNVISETTAQ